MLYHTRTQMFSRLANLACLPDYPCTEPIDLLMNNSIHLCVRGVYCPSPFVSVQLHGATVQCCRWCPRALELHHLHRWLSLYAPSHHSIPYWICTRCPIDPTLEKFLSIYAWICTTLRRINWQRKDEFQNFWHKGVSFPTTRNLQACSSIVEHRG